MKLVKLLAVLVLLAAGVYLATALNGQSDSSSTANDDAKRDVPGVEEKYGFTTQTVDP